MKGPNAKQLRNGNKTGKFIPWTQNIPKCFVSFSICPFFVQGFSCVWNGYYRELVLLDWNFCEIAVGLYLENKLSLGTL